MMQKAEEEKGFFSAGMVSLHSYQVLQHESAFVKTDRFWLLPTVRVYSHYWKKSSNEKEISVHVFPWLDELMYTHTDRLCTLAYLLEESLCFVDTTAVWQVSCDLMVICMV